MKARLVKIFNDNHPRTEMSKDEMMIFMGMIMSKDESLKLCVDELDKESKIYKELKPLFEGFQLKVFLGRLEALTSLRITVGAFVILSQYFSNAGVAVMYAYYLHQMLPANTIVDVHVISEKLFPWGFFSPDQLSKMWDEQKVQLKDGLDESVCHGVPDNLLDYNESWEK